jgi:hypothetical protein
VVAAFAPIGIVVRSATRFGENADPHAELRAFSKQELIVLFGSPCAAAETLAALRVSLR